jgi:hypothetical protein
MVKLVLHVLVDIKSIYRHAGILSCHSKLIKSLRHTADLPIFL